MRTKRASLKGPLRAALLTPPGEGGISVIALWGRGAAAAAAARLRGPKGRARRVRQGRLVYGFLCGGSGEVLDEVIVACTRADYVEVNCHGGALPARRILEDLSSSGVAVERARFSPAAAGETGVVEREALEALFGAMTELAARVLAAQAGGALSAAVAGVLQALGSSPPGVQEALCDLKDLAATAEFGIALARPAVIAVLGPANAGKSTLVNALAGYQRNIVTDVPGTTRDAVRVPVALSGVPAVLVDTAGALDDRAALASQAARRASGALGGADAALVVVDGSSPLEGYRPHLGAKPAVVAANKADLGRDPETLASLDAWGLPVVETSGLGGTGIAALSRVLLSALGLSVPGGDAARKAVLFAERQRLCIKRALKALETGDVDAARQALQDCIGRGCRKRSG